ncbi:MAG: hypothetical protein IT561_12285 [Alphaproteobacteria bacterium]|nr:hypothetical protein [Alphaproteobacteria bacterium]
MAGWLASVAFTATVAAAAGALGQPAPTPLLGPPVRLETAPGTAPTPLPQERATRPRRDSGVTARPLPALDRESAGWTTAEGGFGTALWHASRWATVERLLGRLPAAATPARHALARGLLMSAAARPEGAPDGAFLERRLAGLLALGDGPAAHALARALPAERLGGPLARPAAEAALLAGVPADACRAARRPELDTTELFWRRLLVACDALDGQGDRVALGLDLLREQGRDPGAAFVALVEAALGGEKPAVDALPDGLAVVLAAKAGAAPTAAALAAAGPGVAAAIARADAMPPALRLAAAERMAARGLVDGTLLARLYAGLPLPPEALAEAAAGAAKDHGPAGRALLFQAARLQVVPAQRLERLAAGWRHAAAAGVPLAYAAAAAPLVAEISPSADLVPHAAAALRIAFAAGDVATADRWLTLVGARIGDRQALAVYAAAAPLLRLARGDEGPAWNAESAQRWSAAMGGPATSRTAVGLALLASLGDLADSDEWVALAREPDGPPPASSVWFAQEAAAREARLGEQVALALIALGEAPVPHPLAAFSALNGLRLAEQTPAARRIALEIALLAGL